MTIWQRFRFYLLGFIPGCIILFFIVNKKGCTSGNELKMQELLYQHLALGRKAACKLKCLHLTENAFKTELKNYEVDYDLSEVHVKPCGHYYIKSKDPAKALFELTILDCDTNTIVNDIRILDPKVVCDCDSL